MTRPFLFYVVENGSALPFQNDSKRNFHTNAGGMSRYDSGLIILLPRGPIDSIFLTLYSTSLGNVNVCSPNTDNFSSFTSYPNN